MGDPGVRSLHVITSTARRGAETFAVELVAVLRSDGARADVVALQESGLPGSHDVPALGNRSMGLATIRALRRTARPYDIVVAHGSSTLPACALGLAGSGVPFIYRNIGDPTHWIGSAGRRLRVRFALRRAAAVVALWPDAATTIAQVHGLPRTRLTVVPNAVSASRFTPRTDEDVASARTALGVAGAPVVVFVGALSEEKRVADVVVASAELPGSALLVAGEGPERPQLEEFAAIQAPGQVQFLGQVADVRQLLAAADVLVLPSETEGLPGALIEAAFVGTPIVATAVGGIPWMIKHGVTGILVPPGEPAELKAAIERAAEEGASLAAAARHDFIRRFDMPVVAAEWLRLMEQVAAGP